MSLLVSAKSSDVLAWRAAGDFAATFRQVTLARIEFCRSDEADVMLKGTSQLLEDLATANDMFCSRCDSLIKEVSECDEPDRLGKLTTDFYVELYDHSAIHKSAPVFYQFSTLFLQALAGSINRFSCKKLGNLSTQLPELSLIALGPAGRQEFTPFCTLQFMLVHEQVDNAMDDLVQRYADLVHEGFKSCGLLVDDVVTPRNNQWRGSLSEWSQRLDKILKRGKSSDIIEILRLTDQTQFYGAAAEGESSFRHVTRATLADSRVAAKNLVGRVVALSNGISIMGNLRFEKSGSYRGQFALYESALLPLSASISALGLLKQLESTATPQRVRELLWRRELNVDMAERLLLAWHTLHEIRLIRERAVQPAWQNVAPLYLTIEQMDVAEQEALRESLEAIGNIQRHLGINFSGAGV